MLHKKDLNKNILKKVELFINANYRKKYIYFIIKSLFNILYKIKNSKKK